MHVPLGGACGVCELTARSMSDSMSMCFGDSVIDYIRYELNMKHHAPFGRNPLHTARIIVRWIAIGICTSSTFYSILRLQCIATDASTPAVQTARAIVALLSDPNRAVRRWLHSATSVHGARVVQKCHRGLDRGRCIRCALQGGRFPGTGV